MAKANTVTIASNYVAKGYCPIPVRFRGKQPLNAGWTELRIDADNIQAYFNNDNINIGVILGQASNGLIDIDFDDPDALKFASYFLPQTDCIFGRASNPRSHWLYQVPDPQPRRPFSTKGKEGMIIEVRGNGAQTVFPGSIHESGETIEFETDGEPTVTDWHTLETGAKAIAIATVIYKAWTTGNRHAMALAASGFLATRGWPQVEAEQLIEAIVKQSGDYDLQDRLNAVASTFEKVNRKEPIAWREALETHLGKEPLAALEKWVPSPCPSQSPTAALGHFDSRTDAGAADAFAATYQGKLIWALGENHWYRLGNKIYRKVDPVVVQGLAKGFLQRALGSGPMLNRNRINATVELCRAALSEDPDKFDVDENLLGMAGGSVLDLSGPALLSSPQSIVTRASGVAFNAKATCPKWEAFLDRIFSGDKAVISFLQRAVGYSLTGSVKEQAAFILIGKGANGKSTFLNTLLHLFGDYATTVPMQTLMEQGKFGTQTNDLASLVGKRVVVASEGERDQKLAENKIKLMTGGDRIKCRHLYQEFFEFTPVFKLWLATNNLPSISGSDDAIWRRLRIIDFPVSIPPEEQDPDLAKNLLAELSGILNWALEGHRIWRQQGLQTPDSVTSSTKNYRNENDVVGQWLGSCCMLGMGGVTPMVELYASYSAWCLKSGFEPKSSEAFGKELTRKGFENIKGRDGNKRKGVILLD